MAKYVYLVTDLVSGTIRDEIPFTNVTYSIENGAIGGFDGTCPINTSVINAVTGAVIPNRVTMANLKPANTGLWILRDGVPEWGGIIWSFAADLASRTVRFAGQDFLSWYAHQVLGDLDFTVAGGGGAQDQFLIANTLIADAQIFASDVGAGYPNTLLDFSASSGVNRERSYHWYEHQNVLQALTELAHVQNGFDFALEFGGSQAAGLTHRLRLSYPHRGTVKPVVFDAAKNVSALSWNQDATGIANVWYATGAGEADAQLQSPTANPGAWSNYPYYVGKSSYSDVSEQGTLDSHASQDLSTASQPAETISVQVLPDDIDATLGTFSTGDTVRVMAHDGFVDLDQFMRVQTRSVTVDKNGAETMKVDLVGVETTQ